MFQFVRENTDEALIIRRLASEVRRPVPSGEEDGLQRSSTTIRLIPAFASLLQGASPKSQLASPQSCVRQFKDDAANIFVGEEVIPRELHSRWQ
jgi:hypothetical protein